MLNRVSLSLLHHDETRGDIEPTTTRLISVDIREIGPSHYVKNSQEAEKKLRPEELMFKILQVKLKAKEKAKEKAKLKSGDGSLSGGFVPCKNPTQKWLHAVYALSFSSLKLLAPRSVISVANAFITEQTNPSQHIILMSYVKLRNFCFIWSLRGLFEAGPQRRFLSVYGGWGVSVISKSSNSEQQGDSSSGSSFTMEVITTGATASWPCCSFGSEVTETINWYKTLDSWRIWRGKKCIFSEFKAAGWHLGEGSLSTDLGVSNFSEVKLSV